ncbi:Uncharacterised protein [Bifidobacterium catenulatum]|nr:Uncharacterised protein [Bifidobacterium catenulatum]
MLARHTTPMLALLLKNFFAACTAKTVANNDAMHPRANTEYAELSHLPVSNW